MKRYAWILLGAFSCVGPQASVPESQRTQNLQGQGSDAVEQGEGVCMKDDDCDIIASGCCSCNSGGTNSAVNKSKKDGILRRRETACKEIMCIAVISNDKSCTATKAVCQKGQCELSY